MKVEVLGAEVREHGDVDLTAAQLAQRERVTRGFQNAPRPSCDQELREELLDLDRLLSALARLVLPFVIGHLEVDRGGEARPRTRCFEDVRNQMDGRGLSV